MSANVIEIVENLRKISTTFQTYDTERGNELLSDTRSNAPYLTRLDLGTMAEQLALKLESLKPEVLEEHGVNTLKFLEKITLLRDHVVPDFTGYSYNIDNVDVYLQTLQWANDTVDPFIRDWEKVEENYLPKKLTVRARAVERQLNNLIGNKDELASRIGQIYTAGPMLDIMSERLGDLNALDKEISGYKDSTQKSATEASLKVQDVDKILSSLKEAKTEAEATIKLANEALGGATTVSLSKSFSDKADRLKNSINWWIALLIGALCLSGWIGHERFEGLKEAMTKDVDSGNLWILIFLSVLSFGAPVWFAWLATKQINQTFKLKEDYAYKASVAKAYEGYKKEAAKIDKELEQRLFASALTRLDEQPLRFMDKESHGSPVQEALNNIGIMKIFKDKPELFEKYLDIITKQFSKEKSETPSE